MCLLVLFSDSSALHVVENSWRMTELKVLRCVLNPFWFLMSACYFWLELILLWKWSLNSPFSAAICYCRDKEYPGWTRLPKRSQERGLRWWMMEDEQWSFNAFENCSNTSTNAHFSLYLLISGFFLLAMSMPNPFFQDKIKRNWIFRKIKPLRRLWG